MLKKTAAFGSLLTILCASSTLAHGPNFKSGFLAGAHVGISSGSGKFNSTFNINPVAPVNSSSANGTARKTALLMGFFGGYRQVLHEGYTVGFNIEANFFNNDELSKKIAHFSNPPPSIDINNRLKRSFNVIPSVSLGRVFCGRWHASLGLGLAITKFKQQINITSAPLRPLSANVSGTKLGFVPSVGLEYAATQNISLTGNISYEIYKKLNNSFNVDATGAPAPSSYTSSISPKYLMFKVGATYRF
ncbi:MAG: outer membrane protein [Candidatus Paracaedibacter sp.]